MAVRLVGVKLGICSGRLLKLSKVGFGFSLIT